MERKHDDDDAPGSARRALRQLIEGDIRPDDAAAPEVAVEFFGRTDAFELIQEAIIEGRLVRTLEGGTASRSHGESRRSARVPRRERPAFVLHTGTSGPGSHKSWRKMAIAAAALAAIGLGSGAIAIRAFWNGSGIPGEQEYREASTGVAQLDTLELPDGSRAIMAPNTNLRYAIAPKRGPRMVALEGEAYFEVRHDDERPFRVQTRSAMVADLGTSFVVREYAADANALVAVRTGAASVVSTAAIQEPPETMHPGDGAYVDPRGEISRFVADPETYGAWTSGKLAFDAAALPDVLDRLGRWYDVDFRLDDTTLSKQYFTGEFRSVPLVDALAILGPLVHAHFAQEGRVVVVTEIPAGR